MNQSNVFIYARISTSQQDLDQLIRECHQYCKKHNLEVTQSIGSTCSSTKNKKARRLDELFDVLKSGDIIVTTELSRLGRNVEENREIFLDFKKKGVCVRFTRDSHSVLSDKLLGGLLFEVFSLFAEMERSMISERTSAALRGLKAKGIKLGRKYSEDYENPKLKGNEEQIKKYLSKKLSLLGIARLYGVHVGTLRSFIRKHSLIY